MTAMNGTKKAHTLAMPWMPPSITRAVNAVRTAAVPQKGMEKAWWSCSAAAFPCVRLPIPKAAMAVKTAKAVPSHLLFRPRSSTNMGPPLILPSLFSTRYLMASNPSE
jgi:hypothetical protein